MGRAAERDHAVLHSHTDCVEDIAITHAIIRQLFNQAILQLGIGDIGPANSDIVANAGDALHLLGPLHGVRLVLIEIDRS
jgi:hypothetical protein